MALEQLSAIFFRRGDYVYYRCPGCNTVHSVPINRGSPSVWTWNGDAEKPTLSPSVRHFHPEHVKRDHQGIDIGTVPERTYCHYHIKEGFIDYCNDCTHHLNGRTGVPMEPLPLPDKYGYGGGD